MKTNIVFPESASGYRRSIWLTVTGLMCMLLLGAAVAPTQLSKEWAATKNSDGITAYIATSTSNGIKATRVEMTVSATMEKVLKAIVDLDHYSKWIPYCKQSYTLKKLSDTEYYGYQRMSAPLVTDRDVVVRLTVRKTGSQTCQVQVAAMPDFIKRNDDAIRIQRLIAIYNLQADTKGNTHVEQTTSVDIGGSIPAFLINWTNNSQPHETFENLRAEIMRP